MSNPVQHILSASLVPSAVYWIFDSRGPGSFHIELNNTLYLYQIQSYMRVLDEFDSLWPW